MSFELNLIKLSPKTPVFRAMQILDKGGTQLVLVVDSDEQLLGTLTDGDIRRGLLTGETLDTSVDKLMNTNFRSVSCDDDEAVLAIMRREHVSQMPVLDSYGRVVKLLLLQDLIALFRSPTCCNHGRR